MISPQETRAYAPWTDTLPNEWRICRLKSVASIRYGLGQPPAELASGVAMIRATDVDAGTIRTENLLRVDPQELPLDRDPYLKTGEIIVVRSGAYTGDSAIIPPDLEGAVAGYDMVVTAIRASSHFVAYSLLSKYVLDDQINLLTLRAAQPHLNAEELGGIILAMPPTRHEQQRIATYLDTSCAAIDAAVAAKRRQIETLDTLRKTTITRALTLGLKHDGRTQPSGQDWLGEISQHWKPLCLKRLLREPLTYGLNEAAELEDRDLPRYLRITDFDDDGMLRDDTFRSLPWEVARDALLQSGDVLFARSGATVGKTFMFRDYSGEACFAGYLIRARTLPWKLDSRFLYLFTKTLAYDAWKNLIFTQATIQNISAAKYNYLMIPVPPLSEQQAIVEHVEEKDGEYRKLMVQIERQISTLTAYRKSLIHECVTGQRRVTEADVVRAQGGGRQKL